MNFALRNPLRARRRLSGFAARKPRDRLVSARGTIFIRTVVCHAARGGLFAGAAALAAADAGPTPRPPRARRRARARVGNLVDQRTYQPACSEGRENGFMKRKATVGAVACFSVAG